MRSTANRVLPEVPPHLRSYRVGDLLPLPIPRDPPPGHRHGSAAASSPADIYHDETPWLIRFFRRRLGNIEEAQDLAHDAITRLLSVLPSASISNPQAYLRRVAANLLRDHVERGSTRLAAITAPLDEGHDAPDTDDPLRTLVGREELGHWAAILRRLPPRTLDVFLLSRCDGFTYKEIADHIGISVWSVKRHMTKALAHLDQNRSGAP